jgi:hypothetical protein
VAAGCREAATVADLGAAMESPRGLEWEGGGNENISK